jgi:hypothetical protein
VGAVLQASARIGRISRVTESADGDPDSSDRARLIIRDYPDPRFDWAWFYFTIGMLVLIVLSGVLMIYR